MALAVYIKGWKKGSLEEQRFITLLAFHIINLCERNSDETERRREQREAHLLRTGGVYGTARNRPARRWVGGGPSAISSGYRIVDQNYLRGEHPFVPWCSDDGTKYPRGDPETKWEQDKAPDSQVVYCVLVKPARTSFCNKLAMMGLHSTNINLALCRDPLLGPGTVAMKQTVLASRSPFN